MKPLSIVYHHRTIKGAQITFWKLRNALSDWHAYQDGDVWLRCSPWGKKVKVYFMPQVHLGELFERLYEGGFHK